MKQKSASGGSVFKFIYILWSVFVLLCLCSGLGKYGHVFAALVLYGPALAATLFVLYFPLKWAFVDCTSRRLAWTLRIPLAILLCAGLLLPARWAWEKNYYPDCGVAEMERMVAEGTAYFEEHREELEQQAAVGEDPFYWTTSSGRTFGSLEYYRGGTPAWEEKGYPMHYPLDEHWALCFFEDYS